MNDEIKEIINYFKDDIEYLEKEFKNTNYLGRYITIRDKECDYLKKLLDYITNLQQENYELNRMCELYSKSLYYAELKDYKSRCEKAIEYNNQIIKDTKDFYRPTTDIIYSGDSLIEIATNNINILQNGSDNNEK